MFPAAPSSFLPSHHRKLCSRGPDPSLAHRPGSVSRPRVMESGRCWRPGGQNTAVPLPRPTLPGGDYAQSPGGQGSQDQKGAGRESRGSGHAFAPCQPLLIAEISIWECLDPQGGPRLSYQGRRAGEGVMGTRELEAGEWVGRKGFWEEGSSKLSFKIRRNQHSKGWRGWHF